jgi:hypothetical protein
MYSARRIKKSILSKTLASLFSLLLSVFFISYCSNDNGKSVAPQKPFKHPIGISDFQINKSKFSYTIRTETDSRFVNFKRHGMSITASIEGPSNNLLFEVSVEMDGNSLIVSERTEYDFLEIKRTQTKSNVQEHFNLNGRDLTITYPKLDDVTMANSYNNYQRGIYDAIDPELLQAFIEFEDYYSMDNTLNWNPDAEILISSLMSKEFTEISTNTIITRTGETAPLYRDEARNNWFVDVYCGIVSIGTGIKCLFGGPANVLCDAGTIISIACALFQIATTLGLS